METKLTLRLKRKTIERGKIYAKKRNTSLSKMIENYLDKISITPEAEVSFLVKDISGVMKGASENYKREYADYLEKKYK